LRERVNCWVQVSHQFYWRYRVWYQVSYLTTTSPGIATRCNVTRYLWDLYDRKPQLLALKRQVLGHTLIRQREFNFLRKKKRKLFGIPYDAATYRCWALRKRHYSVLWINVSISLWCINRR
jgi:hypothetical protein